MEKTRSVPSLKGWEETRDTLSGYAKAIGAIPWVLAEPHPKWWHISLKIINDGLQTDEMKVPSSKGETFNIRLDFEEHAVIIKTSTARVEKIRLRDGASNQEFSNKLLDKLKALGIKGDFDPSKFEGTSATEYDPAHARAYQQALSLAGHVLQTHKEKLSGETGPVQLWPHHFDLAFEWFGTRTVPFEEEGKTVEYPSQINFGFSPGDSGHPTPYFYSNPWPFEKSLETLPLPKGASWNTEGWEGSLLSYETLVTAPNPAELLLDYYETVFAAASELLTV
jgi:hypothetical protein